MDGETQPFLVDAGDTDNAARPSPQHFCARCSSESVLHQDDNETKTWTFQHILIIVPIIVSISRIILMFAIAEMSSAKPFESSSVLQISVTLWTDMTMTFLGLLLYMSQIHRKGSRTAVEIKVLCALGVSWIIFIIVIAQNTSVCTLRSLPLSALRADARSSSSVTVNRELLTTIHVFSWFLVFILFSAAYATYRRAILTHGTNMAHLPNPPMVAARRLANIPDAGAAIKI